MDIANIIDIEEESTADDLNVNEKEIEDIRNSPLPLELLSKPCLACGSNLISGLEVVKSEFPVLPENEIFTSFCELLKIRLSGKLVWWDFNPESGSSRIFCEDCKGELTLLQDLKKRLLELETDLKNGIETFKDKCYNAEVEFHKTDVYQKDKRYVQIRRQIKRTPAKGCHDTLESTTERPRRSTRPRRLVSANSASSSKFPIVELSVADKTKADLALSEKNDHVEEDSPLLDPLENLLRSDSSENSHFRPEGPSHGLRKKRRYKKRIPTQVSSKSTSSSSSRTVGRKRTAKNDSEVKVPAKRGRKPKEQPKKSVIVSDDDTEEEEETETGAEKKKRTRRSDDEDYEPDDAIDEDNYNDGVNDKAGGSYKKKEVKKARLKRDTSTGQYYFLHVAFKRLPTGKFQCLECKDKEMIIFKNNIRRHSFRAHTKIFSCKECDHCAGSSGDLEKHVRWVHKGERFIDCPICGKPCSSSLSRDRLQRHMATHYSEQEKQEAIARGEKILTWRDFHSKKNCQCDNCGKGFGNKWELRQHIKFRHPGPKENENANDEIKELCSNCGKLFLKIYLKRHQFRCGDSTNSNKKFICTICDKRFYRHVELSRHKRNVHEKDNRIKCPQCPRTFGSDRLFKIHKNRHLDIRPYPCPHCPVSFFTKGNCSRHVGIYHTEGAIPKRKTYLKKPPQINVPTDSVASSTTETNEKEVLENESVPKFDLILVDKGHDQLLPTSLLPLTSAPPVQDLANAIFEFSNLPNPM